MMVVKDPVTGKFYRLRELELFIVDQCDGATAIETIRRRAEAHFEAPLPEPLLRQFLAQMRTAGLVETPTSGPTRVPARSSRFAGPLLYRRFRVINPDRLLARLVAPAGFLYTAPFLAIAAVSLAAAWAVTFSHWAEISAEFFRVLHPAQLPLFLLIAFGLGFAHECAHGLTCKRFGGQVPELGVMFIYFQPAFYCNVSDAWLFPEKSRRLWVGLAGPLFELFLWSVATLAWRVTERGASIHDLAYMVMTASGIKTLLNFNPLLKLDGYYLLSDLLDVPNLRRRAFAYLGSWLTRLGGRARTIDTLTARERGIFLAYGLVALVFSFGVLGVAFAKLGRMLLQHQQPLSFALVLGMAASKVGRRIRRLFPNPKPVTDDDDEDEDESSSSRGGAKTESPPDGAPPPASTAPDQPQKGRRRARTRLFVAACFVLAVVLLGRSELKVRGPVLVLPIHNADVRAGVDGTIEEVFVREGQRVHRGEPIARLSGRDLNAELEKAEAGIEQQQASLRMLEAGPIAEEVAVARAEVAKAVQHLESVQKRLAMDRVVFEAQLLTKRELLASQDDSATAENDMAEARGRLNLLLKGTRPELIEATSAELKGLESTRTFLTDQLRLLTVLSPVTGVVATPAAELKELKDKFIHRGDLIAKVYELETLTAQIPVSEHDIADVRVHSKVLLKARSYPNRTFQGVVTAVGTASEGFATGEMGAAAPVNLRVVTLSPGSFVVTTEIDNRAQLLRPGMTGEAKILAGRRSALELAMRWLSHTINLEFWSWS